MPVKTTWIIEGSLLFTEVSGSVSAEELVKALSYGRDIVINEGIAPVYSVIDFSKITKFPVRLNEIMELLKLPPSPKLSMIFLSGIPNQFGSFLATTFAQLSRRAYKVTKTADEAFQLIEEIQISQQSDTLVTP